MERIQLSLIIAVAITISGCAGSKAKQKPIDVPSSQIEAIGSAGSNGNAPKLRPAQVRVKYVEDQIKDGTFIPAHFEYEIAEPARWENSK